MATMMRSSVACRAARPTRASVVVRAAASGETSRRGVFGLLAGAVAGALLAAPQQAEAVRIPSQEFTGGLVKGGGNSPKSPTAASMESYTMEGSRKQGVSPKKRAKLLAKTRADAEKIAKS